MRLDRAADIRLGGRRVTRVALGERTVWPQGSDPDARLEVSPDTIWLLRAADWTDFVDIISNVRWRVG